jgi:hypothetical protein
VIQKASVQNPIPGPEDRALDIGSERAQREAREPLTVDALGKVCCASEGVDAPRIEETGDLLNPLGNRPT